MEELKFFLREIFIKQENTCRFASVSRGCFESGETPSALNIKSTWFACVGTCKILKSYFQGHIETSQHLQLWSNLTTSYFPSPFRSKTITFLRLLGPSNEGLKSLGPIMKFDAMLMVEAPQFITCAALSSRPRVLISQSLASHPPRHAFFARWSHWSTF